MPELPDVEVWRRYVDATSLHQRITGLGYDAADLRATVSRQALDRALLGRRLRSTGRHGKHLFAGLADGDGGADGEGRVQQWLRLHFGMTGALRYYRVGDEPDHTRLRIDFEDGFHLAFQNTRKLGMIDLLEDPDRWIREEGLGPDALRVGRKRFRSLFAGRRGLIKSLLMDQRILAGLGNVYADELLYQERLHPRTPAGELDRSDLNALHDRMGRVLEGAVQSRADPGQMPADWLVPHRHPGGSCPRCGGELKTVDVGGRTAYFCPDEQVPPSRPEPNDEER